MPSTRTVRRAKKRSTRKLSRYSSIGSGFSKSKLLITSSPLQDNLMEKEFLLNSLEDYKFEFQKRFNNLTRQHQEDMTTFATMIQRLKMSVPADIATATLGSTSYSLKSKTNASEHDNLHEESSSLNNDTFLMPIRNTKILGSSDNVFKRPQECKGTKRINNKLLPPTTSKFKTPDISSQLSRSIYTAMPITPKMNPHTPMNMMRLPKQGEVAVSMTGSPLLVSSILHDQLPHVTVPFADGRVFSIMPNPGVTPNDVPEFDEQTKAYLKTLQDHLNKFCSK